MRADGAHIICGTAVPIDVGVAAVDARVAPRLVGVMAVSASHDTWEDALWAGARPKRDGSVEASFGASVGVSDTGL